MAAISAIEAGAKNIAVISKVVPTSSHTVAAKGGINATLSNVENDDWKWHAYDTLKGADYLADNDAVELLCREAQTAILDLEKMGVVFSRGENGKISQRAYGGQTTNFGQGGAAYRACYSKDKTGHTILHTLHEQALKNGVKFFSEFFVTDLLVESSSQEKSHCHGCLALDLNSGELVIFSASTIILATGGYSQIYQNTTSSLICTGDGSALVFKEGLPLQDMEFVQFHPTGIQGLGFLVTEAARGEGGYLVNSSGERFMQNYAPKMLELASRDVVSQAMATEIRKGEKIYLDLRHLSEEVLYNKLPGVIELVKNFVRLDVKKDLIPVSPSAHYTMGGIPTDLDCNVIDGLMAVGETACVSVHGANRLGCNSLLDLIVFGKIAGKKAAEKSSQQNTKIAEKIAEKIAAEKIEKLKNIFIASTWTPSFDGVTKGRVESGVVTPPNDGVHLPALKKLLQEANEKYLGVFRDEKLLELGLAKTCELYEIFKNYKIKNKNLIWNEELVAYFELENLLLNSLATNFSALNRRESRGAHYRSDFENRDDKNFHAHSLVRIKNGLEFSLKPVRNFSKIPELNLELKKRNY